MATGSKLVIVESPTKRRRLADTWAPDTRSWHRSAISATCSAQPGAGGRESQVRQVRRGYRRRIQAVLHRGRNKKKTVADLKSALKKADTLYLATDEDREGEAIAWHLVQTLKPKVPVKRMVFHEITPEAIKRR